MCVCIPGRDTKNYIRSIVSYFLYYIGSVHHFYGVNNRDKAETRYILTLNAADHDGLDYLMLLSPKCYMENIQSSLPLTK